jgi:hypothetical protein
MHRISQAHVVGTCVLANKESDGKKAAPKTLRIFAAQI